MKKTILIVEDEYDLAQLVAYNLEREGYLPVIAENGVSGLEQARAAGPDLILLDLMLPGMPGIEVCRTLKKFEKTATIPIIILTARGEEIDRVVGFEVGADDFLVKPFSTRELLLRINAVLRRTGNERDTVGTIKVGPLSIDSDRHMVSVADEEVILTSTEFKLLLSLAERLGRVQSRDRLLKDVWEMSHIGDTRTVDTHITRLRTKLGACGDMIKTIRGFGYKMEAE
jgi:two-component system phosphate regulon response regulator PhoB